VGDSLRAGAETDRDVDELIDASKLMEGVDEGTVAQLHYYMHQIGGALPFEDLMRDIQAYLLPCTTLLGMTIKQVNRC
jgi:hypothetical protein